MGTSQSQVEILLTARNAATAAFADFSRSVTDIATNLLKSADASKVFSDANTAAGGSADKASAAFEKMVSAFSGETIVAKATMMADAVDKVGGVSMLTDTELQKLGNTAQQAIDKLEAMGQDVPERLQAIADAAASNENAFDRLFTKFTSGVAVGVASGELFVGALAKIGEFAMEGAAKVVDFFEQSVAAAAQLESAQARLSASVTASGHAADGSLDAFRQLAEQIADTTTTSKTSAVDMEARFIQLGGVTQTQMGHATQAALDLSAGLKIDLTSAVTMISKALEGHVTGLQRYGVVLDQSRVKAEGASYIFEALNQRFGGQSQMQLETYAGQVQKLGNTWEEFQASVGKVITQDPVVDAVLHRMNDAMENISDSTKQSDQSVIDYAASTLESLMPAGGAWQLLAQRIKEEAIEETVAYQIHGMTEGAMARMAPIWANAAGQLPPITAGLQSLTDAQKAANKEFDNRVALQVGLTAAEKAQIANAVAVGLSAQEAAALTGANTLVVERYIESLKKVPDAAAQVEAALEKLFDRMVEIEGNGPKIDFALQSTADALKGMGEHSEIAEQQFLPIFSLLDKIQGVEPPAVFALHSTADALENLGEHVSDVWPGLVTIGDIPFSDTLKGWTHDLSELAGAFSQLAQQSSGSFGQILGDVAQVTKALDTVSKGMTTFQQGYENVDLGQETTGIVSGAAGVLSAASGGGVKGTVGGAVSGMEMGASIGSIVPGIGTAIGAAVGAIGGALVGIAESFGASEAEKAGRTVEANFEKQFGGFDQMMTAVGQAYADTGHGAAAAQADVKALMAAETQGGDAVQAAINKINAVLADEKTHVADVAGGVQGILDAAKTVGLNFPSALQPVIAQLTSLPGLTDAEKSSLLELANAGKPSFSDLSSAAGRYGLSLDSIGGKVAQLSISTQADQIESDYKTLVTTSGADSDKVLAGMAGSLNTLVQHALDAGDVLPTALQPLVDQLFNTGQLTDSTGKKLTDLSGLKFDNSGDPLATGMSGLTTAIDGLITLLGGTVPAAFDATATASSDTSTKLTKDMLAASMALSGSPDSIAAQATAAAATLQKDIQDASAAALTDPAQASVVSAAIQAATALEDKLKTAAQNAGGYLAGIADNVPEIDLHYQYVADNGLPRDDTSYAASGGFVTPFGVQYLADGGPVWQPKGTDTQPAMLTPGESVLTVRGTQALGLDNVRALNAGRAPGGVGGPSTAALEDKFDQMNTTMQSVERTVRGLSGDIARAVRDAVQFGRA